MDRISDMLTRIRNAGRVKKENVEVLYSKQNLHILAILKDEGYIEDYVEQDIRKGVKSILVTLKYYNFESSIKEIKRISKSSRRVYSAITDVPVVLNGLGILILSTSQGVMSDSMARSKNIGGEIICSVY